MEYPVPLAAEIEDSALADANILLEEEAALGNRRTGKRTSYGSPVAMLRAVTSTVIVLAPKIAGAVPLIVPSARSKTAPSDERLEESTPVSVSDGLRRYDPRLILNGTPAVTVGAASEEDAVEGAVEYAAE